MLEAYQTVCGVCLEKDETVKLQSKPSFLGLIASWLVLPCFFLAYFIFFYLPAMISSAFSSAFSSAVKGAILDSAGLSELGSFDPVNEIFGDLLGDFGGIVSGIIIGFFVFVFVTIWLVICLVSTYRYFGYSLAITNFRVIGTAKG